MHYAKALTGLVVVFACCGTALAQENFVEVEVTYIAGPNAYISAGRNDGLSPGDTLSVWRSGSSLGLWISLSASSTRSVIKSVGDVTVDVGDSLEITFIARKEIAENNIVIVESASTSTSIMQEVSIPVQTRSNRKQRLVRGRVSSNISGSVSRTTSIVDSGQQVRRTSVIPSLGILLRVESKNGFKGNLNARLSHRHTNPTPFENPTTVRLYSATITRSFESGVSVAGGRFANRDEPFANYWDGISVSAGSDRNRIGAATGFQPDRYNQAFESSLPKYSLFANTRKSIGKVRYDAKVSFTDVRAAAAESRHMFAGWKQRITVDRSRLESAIQLNRDPLDSQWKLVRLGLASSLFFLDNNIMKVDYDRRKSFSIWSTHGLPDANRERVTFSYVYSSTPGSLRLSTARNRYGQQSPINSYVGSITLRRLPHNLSFTTFGSYWRRTDIRGYSYSADVSHTFARGSAGLRYRMTGSELTDRTLVNHSLVPSLSLRFGRSINWMSQVTFLSGDALSAFSFFNSLSIRL